MNARGARSAPLGLKARLVALLPVAILPLLILSLENFRVGRANEAGRSEARLAESARAIANLLERVILQG